jgi:HTH-type transcriptional regulator/antitoxin HigA
MTQKELARRMGRPPQVVNGIIKAKKSISLETALELEKAPGMPARVWVNLESVYRMTKAKNEER